MFGYEILRGKHGAAGHFMESDGNAVIRARGLKPGETCVLYALSENRGEKRAEASADGNGQAVLTGKCEKPFFVAADGKVLLWQGGESNYLRASEWLKREQAAGKKNKNAPNQPEPPLIEAEEAQTILKKDLNENQTATLTDETPKEKRKTAEPQNEENVAEKGKAYQPEPPYALRSPGGGEPVDTLPE